MSSPTRYLVECGPALSRAQHFTEFSGAVAFLIEHIDESPCPRLLGAGFDVDSTGLSDSETDVALEAYEMRQVRRFA